MPRQRSRSTSPEVRDRNTRDILGRPGLAGMVRTGGRRGMARGGESVLKNPTPELGGAGVAGAGQLLILTATADSIASGGDYVTFGAELHRRGFDTADVADGQTIIWPTDTTGSIQVELEWATYEGGGTVEIEVDGAVPAWGTVVEGTSGYAFVKCRGVDITAGQAVKIKVTQASGSAQTADVLVEFKVDGPTSEVLVDSIGLPLQITPTIPSRVASSDTEVFFDQTFRVFWNGSGQLLLANASDGSGAINVDDQITIDVTHADGSTAQFVNVGAYGPADIASHFEQGWNDMRVQLQNTMPSSVGSSAVWLVQV